MLVEALIGMLAANADESLPLQVQLRQEHQFYQFVPPFLVFDWKYPVSP